MVFLFCEMSQTRAMGWNPTHADDENYLPWWAEKLCERLLPCRQLLAHCSSGYLANEGNSILKPGFLFLINWFSGSICPKIEKSSYDTIFFQRVHLINQILIKVALWNLFPLLGENRALFYSNMSLGHNSGLTYLTD